MRKPEAVMRRGQVFALVPVTAALLGTGCGSSSSPPIGPGGKVGAMTLVRGTEHEAEEEIFAFCDAVIPKPGRYGRACSVPRAQRLFIGYGDWERTRKAVDSAWKELKWELWFDGRPVSLSRFDTSERTLYDFQPAGGGNAILREWSVTLIGVTPGKHTVRYRRVNSAGITDATWTFQVLG